MVRSVCGGWSEERVWVWEGGGDGEEWGWRGDGEVCVCVRGVIVRSGGGGGGGRRYCSGILCSAQNGRLMLQALLSLSSRSLVH